MLGGVLLFWGYSEFFGGHNSPILSNICFFGFSASVLAAIAGFAFKHWPHAVIVCFIYILSCGFFGMVIYEYSQALPPNTADSGKYELLPPDVVSNLVQTLKEPDSHIKPSAVLVCAVNPDESAFAFSEQLKKIFQDSGFVLVGGAPPQDGSEIPGVSCNLYGYASANAGLWRALGMILDATKSHPKIEMIPRYPGRFNPIIPQGEPFEKLMGFMRQVTDPNFTNSVAVIMIRKK